MFLRDSAEIPLMSTVAREVGVSVPTLTAQADKLTSLGLLKRVTVRGDRRAMGLMLTERGHTCLDAAMQTIMSSQDAGFLWGMALGLAAARWKQRREQEQSARLRFSLGVRAKIMEAMPNDRGGDDA
jgi:DNA-binding MarR family transcriptional regulator